MDIVYILLRKYSGVGGKATDKIFNCTIKCYSIYEILRKEKFLMLDQNLNFIKTQMMIMTTHRIKLDVPDVIPSEAIL